MTRDGRVVTLDVVIDRCSESFDDATLREVGAEEPTEVKMVVKGEMIDRRVEEGEESTSGVG